jgi:ABC-type multidrug transport system fused ATPase/permease subunit
MKYISLVHSEATASLDTERDEKVQHSIRETFADSTMLVIAHRLRTIIMSDRILVLAPGGTVAEFDQPSTLLEDPASQLSLAVAEMGEKQAQMIRQQSSNLKRLM